MLKTYYALTKPGIIYGNLVTAAAGFFLASRGHINFWLLLATLLGTSLVIASACVFNNYFDRDIDSLMARTKNRAFVKGLVSFRAGITYAIFLGVLGFLVLVRYTNLLTAFVGLIGFFDYVVLYTFLKRSSIYGTIIGSISGATPVVAGYTAVTNHFDVGAALLFLILALWQMPHFYAIGIYRLKDYADAGIPILPVKKGIPETKIQMLFYILAFTVATAALTVFGYTGYTYLVTVLFLSLAWLWLDVRGFRSTNDQAWARKMFLFSLVIIFAFSIMISVGGVLP